MGWEKSMPGDFGEVMTIIVIYISQLRLHTMNKAKHQATEENRNFVLATAMVQKKLGDNILWETRENCFDWDLNCL